ncbi:MAG: ABC-2 family transporter protein [Clostridia bacterium]|nr:ABC-2 family transporter protein [Clostridia bacterium]
MNALKKFIRLYLPFGRSVIQARLSYRIDFFLFVFGGLFRVFVFYYLWKAVFTNSTSSTIAGFTLDEMISYIFISDITGRLVSSQADRTVSEEIKQGSIAINLVRPINYSSRLLSEAIGTVAWQFIMICLPIWLGFAVVRYASGGHLPPDILTVTLYVFSIVLSFLILFMLNFCFGMLAFYTTATWGLSNLKLGILRFFSGELIPIAFFPLWLQNTMNFLPFGSMNYTPVMIYLEKFTGMRALAAIGIQSVWVIIMLLLSRWVWSRVIRRLTVLGG